MENTYPRRLQSSTISSQQHSSAARLLRSRSGSSTSPAITADSINPTSASQRYTSSRSKSTTKSRASSYKSDDEKSVNSSMKKKGQENRGGNSSMNTTSTTSFASPKLLPQRGSTSPTPSPARPSFVPTKGRKSSTSPSAWALSPGRNFQCTVGTELTASPAVVAPPKAKVKSSGGGVSGVLKYFRLQKKGPSVQEEEFHQFRILHNRLLQYRFANARAQSTMVSSHKVAEDRMFSVWLKIFKMRNNILEKRLQLQTLKHQMKLYQILHPQMFLLNAWSKLERKNQESVSRMVRKLSGISNTIPLIHDAKGDVESLHEAMMTAMDVMVGIQATVTKLLPPLEKLLYMVTELLITQKQQTELEKYITTVVGLMKEETSVRVHLIQIASENQGETRTYMCN